MKKTLFLLSLGLVSLPYAVFANITVDYATYVAPATVNYSGGNGNQFTLYSGAGTVPDAWTTSAPANSGVLSSVTWASGSFTGLVAGSYTLMQTSGANCQTGVSSTTCQSLNTANPNYVNFVITAAVTSVIEATSTPAGAQQNLANAVYMFFISLFLVVWLMRKH